MVVEAEEDSAAVALAAALAARAKNQRTSNQRFLVKAEQTRVLRVRM